jgi:hypothetical protein
MSLLPTHPRCLASKISNAWCERTLMERAREEGMHRAIPMMGAYVPFATLMGLFYSCRSCKTGKTTNGIAIGNALFDTPYACRSKDEM